jgi:hypothetical protein
MKNKANEPLRHWFPMHTQDFESVATTKNRQQTPIFDFQVSPKTIHHNHFLPIDNSFPITKSEKKKKSK